MKNNTYKIGIDYFFKKNIEMAIDCFEESAISCTDQENIKNWKEFTKSPKFETLGFDKELKECLYLIFFDAKMGNEGAIKILNTLQEIKFTEGF